MNRSSSLLLPRLFSLGFALLGVGCISANAEDSLLTLLKDGRWAVSSLDNCGVGKKTYQLSGDSEKIVWIDGSGTADVEQIDTISPDWMETHTVFSRNNPRNLVWTYQMLNSEVVRVNSGHGKAFTLYHCEY